MQEEPGLHWKALLRDYRCTKPMIAAVEGYAVAGGTEMLQGTDIRVAGEGAIFGVWEAKRGLFPLGGSSCRLPRQIPYTVAMDILLTARPVSADEALRIGLIGRTVPDGMALTVARGIADQVAACGPLSTKAILRAWRETEHLSDLEAMRHQDPIGWEVFASDDAKEGPRAFAEKRTPNFRRQ
jgi:enoyl-CoA hydratase